MLNVVTYTGQRRFIRLHRAGSRGGSCVDYARSRGVPIGRVFSPGHGKDPSTRNQQIVNCLHPPAGPGAQLPEEKGSQPLLASYSIRPPGERELTAHNITLLVEQAQDRLMEEEQLQVGWDG